MPGPDPSWDQIREVATYGARLIVQGRRARPGSPTQDRLLVQQHPTDELSDLVPRLAGGTACARVSPDGRRLALLNNVADGFWPWYVVVVLDRGHVVEPFGHDTWVAGNLQWSPDGKLVVNVREGVRIGLLATDIDSGEQWWLLRPRGVPADFALDAGAQSAEVTLHDFGVAPRRVSVRRGAIWHTRKPHRRSRGHASAS